MDWGEGGGRVNRTRAKLLTWSGDQTMQGECAGVAGGWWDLVGEATVRMSKVQREILVGRFLGRCGQV